MTVIAWDGKTLCTDQQANDGSMKWEAEKAWYITNKATGKICIVTGVGTLGYIIQLRDWFASGMETALDITPNMAELIVVDDEGLCVFSGEKTYSPVRLKAPMAFGHGREYAMGAMAMGANASDAVAIANEYSLHCGKGVACYTIHPEEKGDNQNG
jgi:hypothetical protein